MRHSYLLILLVLVPRLGLAQDVPCYLFGPTAYVWFEPAPGPVAGYLIEALDESGEVLSAATTAEPFLERFPVPSCEAVRVRATAYDADGNAGEPSEFSRTIFAVYWDEADSSTFMACYYPGFISSWSTRWQVCDGSREDRPDGP